MALWIKLSNSVENIIKKPICSKDRFFCGFIAVREGDFLRSYLLVEEGPLAPK